MAKVAFIGLGNMGQGMARCLLDAGHELSVWNRTAGKAEALTTAGARAASSPRDAVEGAAAIFSMLGDDDASRSVWLGDNGVLGGRPAENAFAIECSTLSYGWVGELAEAVAARGLRYLDCPVTGLPDAAAAGDLVLLAGCSETVLADAGPFLNAVSKQVFRFGPVGAGTAYKLLVNLMGAVQIAGVAEGILMAEKAGLDLEAVGQALEIGQAASPQVVRNLRRMVADDHDENIVFAGKLRLKDTAYGIDLARRLGVDAAFGETALANYSALVEGGDGDVNESKVIDAMRRLRSA